MDSIDTFILIGGRSSRFGSDKAFAQFEGKPLAARAAMTIEAALSPAHITFVTSAADQFGAELISDLGRPVVTDLKPGFGAWSGLHAALSRSRGEWTFLLACDLPFITPEFLRSLTSFIGPDVDAVIPRQPDGRLQPLCAFYRTSTALSVADSLFDAATVPPLASIADRLRAVIVDSADCHNLDGSERLFTNINTASDLAAASDRIAADNVPHSRVRG